MPNLPEGHLLSEVFVRPRVSSHSSKSPGHVGKTGGLPDDMVWPEGEEVEFDDAAAGAKQAYIATVGELVDEEVKVRLCSTHPLSVSPTRRLQDLTAALDPAVRKAAASKRKLDSREALDAFIESGEKRQREQTDDYRRVPGLRRDRPLQHASTTSTSAAPTGARGRTAAPATTTVSTIKPPVQATATARPAGKRLGVGRPRLIMQGTGVKVDWTRLSGS